MLMALLGFAAPFIPDIFSMGRQWMDHRQELQMLTLRHSQAQDEATWRLEEVYAKADVAEMQAIRKPHSSFANQLLDKAAGNEHVWAWAFNMIFIAFAFIDAMITTVRPVITFWAFGIYAAIKTAKLNALFAAAKVMNADTLSAVTVALTDDRAWTNFDQEMLTLIISFWFGRAVRSMARKEGRV